MNTVESIALARCTTTVRALHNATYHRGDAMPAYRTALTQARLKELLDYDPSTGEFTWIGFTGNRAEKVGKVAGAKEAAGYIRIQIEGTRYFAHRLVWLFIYGDWPREFIDHINGDRADNRIANLREATAAGNQQNRKTTESSSTGMLGVTYRPPGKDGSITGRYEASIKIGRSSQYLGRFATPEEAHAAYLKAKAELHTFQPVPRGAQ